MIDVFLLGTGGMMPLPNRALTSLYIRNEGQAILIDCGEGTQTAIRSAGLRFKPIEAIFFTHFHADHISGLPGLLLTLGNEGRTEPLHLYGPEGIGTVVKALCVIAQDLPFEICCYAFARDREERFVCAGLEVDAFPGDHGVACVGYRLEKKRPGKFDPVRAREQQIPQRLWSRLQQGEIVEGYAPEDVLGPSRKGIRIVYATDTRPTAALRKQAEHADLLVLEGMYGDMQKQGRAEESRHMMMQEAAQIAQKAQAKELWLTHFSPATPEPALYETEIRNIFANTCIGQDGMGKNLRFED